MAKRARKLRHKGAKGAQGGDEEGGERAEATSPHARSSFPAFHNTQREAQKASLAAQRRAASTHAPIRSANLPFSASVMLSSTAAIIAPLALRRAIASCCSFFLAAPILPSGRYAGNAILLPLCFSHAAMPRPHAPRLPDAAASRCTLQPLARSRAS